MGGPHVGSPKSGSAQTETFHPQKPAAEAADARAVEKIVGEIQRARPEHQEASARKLSALVKDPPTILAKTLKLFDKDPPQDNWLIDMEYTRLINF